MFENILVLDYGTPEALEILRDRNGTCRNYRRTCPKPPSELQPKEFYKNSVNLQNVQAQH
jgi:hypothetical protein